MVRSMRQQNRRVFLGLLSSAAMTGCLSPTLPLPPPEQPEVTGPDPATGEVRLRGSVPQKSQIFAINLRSKDIRGEVVGSDGRYDFFLPAQVGDEVSMFYRQGTDESQSLLFMIRDPDAQSPPVGGAGGADDTGN
jgi:hypothetical protein